jgi:hypothetical protein
VSAPPRMARSAARRRPGPAEPALMSSRELGNVARCGGGGPPLGDAGRAVRVPEQASSHNVQEKSRAFSSF